MRPSPLHWIAAAIALAGAALLTYQWAGARPLWLDEEMIALNLRERTLASLADPLWLAQSAPFGWLALQRLVLLSLGNSELALRLVPLLFGVGTLVTAVWVGRRWMGPVGAAVLVWLCSFGEWLWFHALELKPYSADAFWALLLPALAVRVLESDAGNGTTSARCLAGWWTVAAIGLWFGNGALLVTPGCVAILLCVSWRRHGPGAAVRVAWCGWVWLVSFGAHYALSLRHALGSDYLQGYWAFAVPPVSGGLIGTLGWLAGQLQPLADKPGGTGLWVLFWLAAVGGMGIIGGNARLLGLSLATVPISALVFAACRMVPLYERLSLWIVPALYGGVALFAEAAVQISRRARARPVGTRVALGVMSGLVVVSLCVDVYRRGSPFLLERPRSSNHRLDDRAGVRWLMAQRTPGDVLMTTRLGLPALWWYGAVSIGGADAGRSHGDDGVPIVEVLHVPPGPGCRPDPLSNALCPYDRVLVYLGFRFDDVPKRFDDLLLDRLGEIGTLTAYRKFAEAGLAAVIDLRLRPTARPKRPTRPDARHGDVMDARNGCVTVRPGERW